MEPNPFADEPDDLHSEVESLTEDDDLPELPGSPPDSDSDWSTDSDDDPDPSPNPSQTITITSAKGATTTTAVRTPSFASDLRRRRKRTMRRGPLKRKPRRPRPR